MNLLEQVRAASGLASVASQCEASRRRSFWVEGSHKLHADLILRMTLTLATPSVLLVGDDCWVGTNGTACFLGDNASTADARCPLGCSSGSFVPSLPVDITSSSDSLGMLMEKILYGY